MKSIYLFLLSLFALASCKTSKYGCPNVGVRNNDLIYRSTGHVEMVDTFIYIRLGDCAVISDSNQLLEYNFVMVKGKFANDLKPFVNKTIQFEFTKFSEIPEITGDLVYSNYGCIDQIKTYVGTNQFRSSN